MLVALGQQAADVIEDEMGGVGLGQMRSRLAKIGGGLGGAGRCAGENNGQVWPVFADPMHQPEAIKATGHLDVGKNEVDVGFGLLQDDDGFVRARRLQ